MLHEERHPAVHLGRLDDVVVVEHQHDVVADGGEVVDQDDRPRAAARHARMGALA
jgi:hypothetical protein